MDINGYDPKPPSSLETLQHFNFAEPNLLPEDRIACVEATYWMYDQNERWDRHITEWIEGLGTWAMVGRFMRYQPGIVNLAEEYIRITLGLKPLSEIPPVRARLIRLTSVHGYTYSTWR